MIPLIALLNLGIGSLVAVYLGHGPPGLLEAWDALCADSSRSPRPASPNAKPKAGDLEQLAAMSLEAMLEAEGNSPDIVEPTDEAYDEDADHVARLLAPASPEHWDLDEKYVETSVLKLNIAMIKSGLRANEIDAQLRMVLGSGDLDTVELCRQRLQEDCEVYQQEQADEAQRLCRRLEGVEDLGSLADDIRAANAELTEQIKSALRGLRQTEPAADPDAAAEYMLEEIGHMRVVRHRVRDQHDVAFLAIAQREDRLECIERRLFDDQLTELPNRVGLHCTLHDWWEQQRHRARQISVALFDLDDFTAVNDAHGPLVAERILYHVAKLFRKHSGEHDLAGRYTGQQFLLALCDVGPRTATKLIELLRQSIARMTFQDEKTAICVTASVGITEVTPEDTQEQVLQRIESALAKAKQQGPDCSVVSDGTKQERIESPNLGADYTKIPL